MLRGKWAWEGKPTCGAKTVCMVRVVGMYNGIFPNRKVATFAQKLREVRAAKHNYAGVVFPPHSARSEERHVLLPAHGATHAVRMESSVEGVEVFQVRARDVALTVQALWSDGQVLRAIDAVVADDMVTVARRVTHGAFPAVVALAREGAPVNQHLRRFERHEATRATEAGIVVHFAGHARAARRKKRWR